MTKKEFMDNGGWMMMSNGDWLEYSGGLYRMEVAEKIVRTFEGWSFALATFRKLRKEAGISA